MKKNASITAPIASLLFMGLGQIAILRQYVKGILFAIVEILVLLNFDKIFKGIKGFITLGVQAKPGTPMPQRDHSIFMMLDGLIVIVIVVIIAILYVVNVVDARKGGKSLESNGKFQSTREFISQTADKAFAYIALSPAFVMIAFFVVIPLVFSALVAFTNYSAPSHIPPNNKVDWVGFQTFKDMVNLPRYSQGFARTAVWTLEWALIGTVTTYFGGLFMALALLDKKIKLSKFFRTIFILPYAVPGMISLFIWQNLLNGQFGPITRTLRELGVVQWLMDSGMLTKNLIPWLTDPTLAKTMLIIVNLWLGFPYFMLLITGIMTSMPQDLYEAATIDGANKSQQFRYIT
ncbi:MAG: sugar ABC transporter permease, partial [Clostridia bacterium]|nr:sugar ABC transporter permease [Clostridia bacterium]